MTSSRQVWHHLVTIHGERELDAFMSEIRCHPDTGARYPAPLVLQRKKRGFIVALPQLTRTPSLFQMDVTLALWSHRHLLFIPLCHNQIHPLPSKESLNTELGKPVLNFLWKQLRVPRGFLRLGTHRQPQKKIGRKCHSTTR